MLQNLMNNKKTSGLVIVGLAAFAYYRYAKMTAEEKSNLTKTIMEKGKSLLEHLMPGGLKNIAGNTTSDKSFSEAGM